MSLSKIDYTNKFTINDLVSISFFTIIKHPITYVKKLIQIGYEPMKPVLTNTLFFGSRYTYPNVFKYLLYIKKIDGFFGLFRGLGYNFIYSILFEFIHCNCSSILKQIYNIDHIKDKDSDLKYNENQNEIDDSKLNNELIECKNSFKLFLVKLSLRIFSLALALIVSYPFQVCLTRSFAEFVGRERIYNNLPINFTQILNLGGFYDGFVPKLYLEIIVLVISLSFKYSGRFLYNSNIIIEKYLNLFVDFVVPSALYSYQLTSTVMSVNNCHSLLASKLEPTYENWYSCKADLIERNLSKRGNKIFFRYLPNNKKPQIYPRKYMENDK